MRTTSHTQAIVPSWFLVDAKGETLGRLATRVAHVLRGKHRVTWTPNQLAGDHVIVLNAEGVVLEGQKGEQKVYYRHSGHFGHLRVTPVSRLLAKNPSEVIIRAVRGMLPRNRLRAKMLRSLHVYNATTHPHEAQQPEALPKTLSSSSRHTHSTPHP